MTNEGLEEFLMEETIDSQRHSCRWQFLVRWLGYGPEHDLWITLSELINCEALNQWYQLGGDGLDTR
jgi:hypothetical protein